VRGAAASPPSTPGAAVTARWPLLAILTTSYGAGAFGMLGISPLLPSLVDGFGLTRLQVAFVIPAVYLGGLLFSLPAGRLADRLGVRPSFLGGLALGAAGLLLGALAPTFAVFLLCLFLAGTGWSVVNPALGKAIMDLFPLRERGTAMGIKQMGLTLGGVVSALVLPAVAAWLGWRAAVVTCAFVVGLPVVLSWRPLGVLAPGAPAGAPPATAAPGAPGGVWAWARRPALLVLFGSGLVLGMVQAAVLSYLPLYSIEALGFDKIGAGLLVAASQAGGAASRLAFGAASDRWLTERRSIWLAFTGACGAAIFVVYALAPVSMPLGAGALAFATGVGAYGWVGIFFVISAEAGGPRQAGLLSGVAFAAIVVGLLIGPAVFGLLLEGWDSYLVPWAAFAGLAAAVATTMLLAGKAIDRERFRP
jgi:MFS transporter, ACS family, hexuronate transporter